MEVGLVCIFSPDPRARVHVDDMARQLAPIGNTTQDGFDAPPIGLRTRTVPWVKNPIARDPATGSILILLGRARLGTQDIPAEALLQRFLRDGQIAFTHLGGSFGVLVWEPQTETLIVAMDRLATKKVYVWNSGETTLVATELRALLGHPVAPREIDEMAVEQFLITSHLVDTRSLVRDVNVLPPGTITRIDRAGMSFERYWMPRISPAQDDGLDKWADRLADVLSPAVMARCGDEPPMLPLSGGLDARSVAAFVPPELAAAATTGSFGHGHCHDVRYGRRIAQALGAPFMRLPIPEDFFRQYMEPVQMLCDGEVSIEAFPMYRLIEMGQPGRTMLMGYLGDALSGSHLLGLDSGSTDRENQLDAVWRKKYQGKGFSEQLLGQVLLPERYRLARGSTRSLMHDALDKAEAETLDEKALVVELYHRQSRYISYFGRLLSARYRVESPFLDPDVLDTFLSMPLVYRQEQRAYRRMLVRHAPRLASIPENKTCKPVAYADTHGLQPTSAPVKFDSRFPVGLQWRLTKAQKKLGELLVAASGGWLGPHNRDFYVHHDESIRNVPEWYRAKLLDSPLAADWFNLPAVEKIFDEHMFRKRDHSSRINHIVAFLTWREKINI